jgi:hypothetical protein
MRGQVEPAHPAVDHRAEPLQVAVGVAEERAGLVGHQPGREGEEHGHGERTEQARPDPGHPAPLQPVGDRRERDRQHEGGDERDEDRR